MTSKRMSISALLSSDSHPAQHTQSSSLQQPSSQQQLYHFDNEPVNDVDSLLNPSGESENTSPESHLYSNSTFASSNANINIAWYQPHHDRRVSPIPPDTRFSVQTNRAPNHPYTDTSASVEQVHSRSYYRSSSPYTDRRYPEREQPVLDSNSRVPAQLQDASTYPPSFRLRPSEYGEKESRRFSSSSSQSKNTDTSDSLLSVLSRTVASEGVPGGPGLTRNISNVKSASSPPLRPPSTLLRRGHYKDAEYDQNQAVRMREVMVHPQDQRQYQRSPFLKPEIQKPLYHYHSDPPRSPVMRMLFTRPDALQTPTNSASTNRYALPPASPSRSQPTHINPAVNPYPHSFTPKVQPHPPSHSLNAQQHRSHIEYPNSFCLKPPSHSLHLPPRLDLTLPLSLSPATISGQVTSPISPRHPHNSAAILAFQTQPRIARYSNIVHSTRSSVTPKDRLPPANTVGQTSNPTTFLSLRNQAIPPAAHLHPSPLPQLVPATNISSHSPHSPSFVLPLRPISPQQRSSSKLASAIVLPLGLEPDRGTWEKNLRNPRMLTSFHPPSTLDAEATKRPSENAPPVPKRPISYDQRRVDESRLDVAEIVSMKTQQTFSLSKVSFSQDRNSVSLNDRGLKLWNNGPVLDDKLPIQREVNDIHHSIVGVSSTSHEESNSYTRVIRSRPEESSLARISTLPLGTLPVPHFERPQSRASRSKGQIEEKNVSCIFHQTNKIKEGRRQPQNPLKAASPKSQSLYPPPPHVNKFEHESLSFCHCLEDRNGTMAESHRQNSPVTSPVTRSVLPQPKPEGGTRGNETISQIDDRSGIVSSPMSEHSVNPCPRPSSNSPSPTDTLIKNSKTELHHFSPRRPSPQALPGSGDTPVLHDSVQYPFPLPFLALVGPTDERRKVLDPGRKIVSAKNRVKRSPIPAEGQAERSPGSTSPNGNELKQSSNPALGNNDTWRSPGPIPANVHTTSRPVKWAASAQLVAKSSPTPFLVPTLSQYSSSQENCVSREEDSHSRPGVEVSEKPSSEQVCDDLAGPVMEEKGPALIPLQSESSLIIDALDPNKHSTETAMDYVSLNNANDQSLPSLTNLPQPLSPVDVEEKPSLVQTFKSLQTPLPIHSQIMHSAESQGLRRDTEEPVCGTCRGTSSVSGSVHGSEVPAPDDIRVIEFPSDSNKTIAHSGPTDTLNEDHSSAVRPQFPDRKRPALEEAKGGGGEDVEVDMMDTSLNIPSTVSSQVGEQSLEDELLSLVGDVRLKPAIKLKTSPESTASSIDITSITPRKNFGYITKVKASNPRGQVKPTNSKNARLDSETLVLSSPNSGSAITPGFSSKVSGRSNRLVPGPLKKTDNASSTTRSVSVIAMLEPALTSTPAHTEERLYCVCYTPYEGDKVMIACDRCDEWYHPTCVDMPDQEVDLVDQFICEKCKKEYPTLKTTYKARCYRGIHYVPDFDKSPPCWKAAKGIFSKYCGDTCGITHMRAKIAQSGKGPNALWPLVRHAKKREGVSVEFLYDGSVLSKRIKLENQGGDLNDVIKPQCLNSTKVRPWSNRDKICFIAVKHNLAAIRSSKEKFKLELEYLMTRRRLLDLAVERASDKFCGWDTRLEMGDIEWAAWIIGREGKKALYGNRDENEEEYDSGGRMASLCRGPVECPRHHGWKTVRDLELQMEVDSKNGSLKQLSETERELKSKIEAIHPTRSSGKNKKKR